MLSLFAHAQTGKALLDKTSAKLKGYTSMYANFSYKIVESQTKKTTNQTGLVITQGEKYNLKTDDLLQIYDGKKVYSISDADKEVTISDANNEDVLLTPTKIINSYKTGYTITNGTKKGNIQYINLTPTKAGNIKKVVIGINTSNYNLYSVSEETKSYTSTLTISKFIPNYPVMPITFQFDKEKYKNYLITNL